MTGEAKGSLQNDKNEGVRVRMTDGVAKQSCVERHGVTRGKQRQAIPEVGKPTAAS